MNIETRQKAAQFFALMDTGAMRSCINYNTFRKLNEQLTQREVPKVIGADGGDLGSMGIVQLTLRIGNSKVKQDFIMCRELRRNIILGVDFAKCNCAGIQWTTNRTRVLSLHGIKAVEVEEDKLGIPVTASYHVKIPPPHNAVFEVNIHADTEGMQVIKGNKHLLEKHPNMYQHKIAMMSEENSGEFPLLAITNLDHIKTLHLAKGEVVGFARPESSEVTSIATYPLSRDPMTVQPTGVGNVSNSAILDLPNVNTNLPQPLLPNPSSHYHQQHHNQIHPIEVNPGQVTNNEILKSIQRITEVMQQQLLLNSKMTEQGIVQTASRFQEMIKAQEKRDLDPALLAIPTFSGEANDRPQYLDWVPRVKNVCDQSGRSFCQ